MIVFKRPAHNFKKFTLTALTIMTIGIVIFLFGTDAALANQTAGPQQSVVSDRQIQNAIDKKIDQSTADRQAIQAMLQREDVRQVAGSAGLDLERASAAAAILSGSSLEMLAAQAREINEGGIVGGEDRIVITTTGIIIILLILILLTN